MASLATLIPLVALDVPGAPEPVLNQAISLAAREFCRRTLVWQNHLSAFDVVADQHEYDLEPELDDNDAVAEIATIVRVELQGRCLAAGRDYRMSHTGQLYLHRPPGSAITAGLKVTVALRPVLGSDYIDDLIMSRYMEQLSYGVKSILMVQPKKTWSNVELGVFYSASFNRAVSELRFDLDRGLGTTGDLTVKQRVF